jgi:hypothetical protein
MRHVDVLERRWHLDLASHPATHAWVLNLEGLDVFNCAIRAKTPGRAVYAACAFSMEHLDG